MNRMSTTQWTTLLVTAITIGVNILANALPLNGQSTGEISDRFEILFVPEGYVFSIWGLIYVGLIAFAIFQAGSAQREDPLLARIRPAYWLASLANSVWIFLWHYEFFALTLVAMLTILGSLISIYWMMRGGRADFGRQERWLLQAPFSVYLGWISVATIANTAQVLFWLGWGGGGLSPAAWTITMLTVAAVLGVGMQWREGDHLYAAVLVWAFLGIARKQMDHPNVVMAAWGAAALLVVMFAARPTLQASRQNE